MQTKFIKVKKTTSKLKNKIKFNKIRILSSICTQIFFLFVYINPHTGRQKKIEEYIIKRRYKSQK